METIDRSLVQDILIYMMVCLVFALVGLHFAYKKIRSKRDNAVKDIYNRLGVTQGKPK